MLRLETETGWWLVTHPDHAHLAGAFSQHWGNEVFARPEPRERALLGIHAHDDGWALRDAAPTITKQGKPSAFSSELVGKYSAFEEIDLANYLTVRERAVQQIAAKDAYAALLVSMHTYNLLTVRADRGTIAPAQLPLLDEFLARQQQLQQSLRAAVESTDQNLEDNFRLLQATDNLSLLTCVDYASPATLLHPMRKNDGSQSDIQVLPQGNRTFRLNPYPFAEPTLTLTFPARHIPGKTFTSPDELQHRYTNAAIQQLTATVHS
ncbi:DUF3891 family protein [Granulicella sp. S190]|uniref:DUF3891 family protein n=1 Tax=Granulicella sp. S190 TaxID=1747226 RepID=UPI00131DFCF1|nr:DUF3891 family protein [Granulicella sp. S190]